jgi:hypothetical protein
MSKAKVNNDTASIISTGDGESVWTCTRCGGWIRVTTVWPWDIEPVAKAAVQAHRCRPS